MKNNKTKNNKTKNIKGGTYSNTLKSLYQNAVNKITPLYGYARNSIKPLYGYARNSIKPLYKYATNSIKPLYKYAGYGRENDIDSVIPQYGQYTPNEVEQIYIQDRKRENESLKQLPPLLRDEMLRLNKYVVTPLNKTYPTHPDKKYPNPKKKKVSIPVLNNDETKAAHVRMFNHPEELKENNYGTQYIDGYNSNGLNTHIPVQLKPTKNYHYTKRKRLLPNVTESYKKLYGTRTISL